MERDVVVLRVDPEGFRTMDSAARMFAILAGIEDVDVQVFDEKPEALSWLRQWRL